MRIVFKLKQIESSGLFVVVVGPSWISEKGCSENETTTQTFESAPFARCWNFHTFNFWRKKITGSFSMIWILGIGRSSCKYCLAC